MLIFLWRTLESPLPYSLAVLTQRSTDHPESRLRKGESSSHEMLNVTKNIKKRIISWSLWNPKYSNHKWLMIWRTLLHVCDGSRGWRGAALLVFHHYDNSAWCMRRPKGWLGTYDSEPEDDLDCLLLFRARSLSPCVRPFLSSSSLFCGKQKRCIERTQWCAEIDFLPAPRSGANTANESDSPGPFPLCWMFCSCCSRWWWCRPPRTRSWSQPFCHSLACLASSPWKHLPLPKGCSASWCKQERQEGPVNRYVPTQIQFWNAKKHDY